MKATRSRDKNMIIIIMLMVVYGSIYAWRMFTNMPWYDELYTYYSFISRGPIYATIHWPLPNNHVGYSFLSGFLSYFGNATIALRGVSFICAVSNIYLVYTLARKLVDNKIAYICVFLYAGVFLVHNMAVQGRGYTLSTTCYLISLLCLYRICFDLNGKKEYIIYSLCLTMGIYAVPSSTFWVIPVCVFGGLFLLSNGRIKTLIKLVIASVAAAIMSFGIYFMIWLSIGSNLLSTDPASAFYGEYQLDIIKKQPLSAAKAGLDYMLASPYIQSMDPDIVRKEIFVYLDNLFEQFYAGAGKVLIVFFAITAVIALARFIKDRTRFLELFTAVSIVLLPVMLIVQSVQPYLRVFSFFGLVTAFSVAMYLDMFVSGVLRSRSGLYTAVVCLTGALLIGLLFTYKYRAPMADRELDIAEVLSVMEQNGTAVNDMTGIYYTDDYQKYVIKFLYDKEIPEYPLGECDYVLVSDTMEDPSVDHIEWPMLTCYGDFDTELLKERYEAIASTDRYTIYKKSNNG